MQSSQVEEEQKCSFSCINTIAPNKRVVMSCYSPRIYLYKITFDEVQYYYYGVHKEKRYNEYYMGSPVTHKWMWDFYTPKKQILQFFEYNNKGYIEAQEVEKRIIKQVYNIDNWCLNENCGGIISLEYSKIGGKIGYSRGLGVTSKSMLSEYGKRGGKIAGEKSKKDKNGICGLSLQERIINGKKSKENKKGIHNLTSKELSEAGKIGYENGLKKIIMKDKENFYKQRHLNNCKYVYKLISPDNEIYETIFLREICVKFNLNMNCIIRVSRGERKLYKGWKATRKERVDNKTFIE